jgi:Excinuclease ABC subunit A
LQRINLATALGSSLVGTLFVLDEPSIGLHPSDTNKLIEIIKSMRDIGNTIVVVEHDLDVIQNADYIIELGPKAGDRGGEIVFQGTYEELLKDNKSITSEYLNKRKKIDKVNPKRISNRKIRIYNPRENNLKMNLVEIPLNCITVVTGVSGSGKSTLVMDIIYNGIRKLRGEPNAKSVRVEKITGYELIDQIHIIDQSPIGRSSRSTPATYTKAFDAIRDVFASTQLARQFGLKPGYFSFNVPGGRCEVCEGDGFVTIDMQFLANIQLTCEACGGKRYKSEALHFTYKGKNIVDVLGMTIDQAIQFFSDIPQITRKLTTLQI